MPDIVLRSLAWIFHTPKRRVRARGLQERRDAVVGRVPSRGALSAFQSGYEICGLAFVVCAAAASGAETTMLKPVQTVSLAGVKGRFDHLAVDVKGQRLFVAALGNNTVEVIDLAVGKRAHSISGLPKPQGVLFLPEFDRYYVAVPERGNQQAQVRIFQPK